MHEQRSKEQLQSPPRVIAERQIPGNEEEERKQLQQQLDATRSEQVERAQARKAPRESPRKLRDYSW